MLSPCRRCLQVAELKQTIEEISDGVQSARKPQRVGAVQLHQRGALLLRCWRQRCCSRHGAAAGGRGLLPLLARPIPIPPALLVQQWTNGGPAGSRGEITINPLDVDGRQQQGDYYTHTDDTRAFQQARAAAGACVGCGRACGSKLLLLLGAAGYRRCSHCRC